MNFWSCESFFRSEIEAEVFKAKFKLSALSYRISCAQNISKGKLKEGTVRERRVWGRDTSRGRWGSFSLLETLTLNSLVLISSRFVKAPKFFFGKCCRNTQGSGLRYSKCNGYLLRNTVSLITGELLSFTCICSFFQLPK